MHLQAYHRYFSENTKLSLGRGITVDCDHRYSPTAHCIRGTITCGDMQTFRLRCDAEKNGHVKLLVGEPEAGLIEVPDLDALHAWLRKQMRKPSKTKPKSALKAKAGTMKVKVKLNK